MAVGSTPTSVLQTTAHWTALTARTLIALDAPLGWPAGLGQSLSGHTAGAPLSLAPNQLFRRETDRVVRQLVGKQSLDVGADRIARTAHAALRFLQALRQSTGLAIPLAWEQHWGEGIQAIEVYPAGTLAACGVRAPGYKRREGDAPRRVLLAFLEEWVVLPDDLSLMEQNHDALDAALCVLAGSDFLRGDVIGPMNRPLAEKEGWIWVRQPHSSAPDQNGVTAAIVPRSSKPARG